MDQINPTDNVIAVLGATGVGKSTFVGLITGNDQSMIGHKLHSCTERVQAIRCSHNGRDYVFLDTPGFDDTKLSDVQVLAEISSWLVSTYKQGVHLSGLLYLQRITDNRFTATSERNTDMFRMLCGPAALKNVMLVTTMWDEVDETTGAEREEQLRTRYWKSMLQSGSRMSRFKHTSESAWEIVEQLSGLQRRPLRLQIEIGDQGKDLSQTAAGKSLFSWLTKMMEELASMIKRLKELLVSRKGSPGRCSRECSGGCPHCKGSPPDDLLDQLSEKEAMYRQADQERERIRPRSRSFADVVRGINPSRSLSPSLLATPSKSVPSFTGSPLTRVRSFSSSLYSYEIPSPVSSCDEASSSDEWWVALRTGLGLFTAASEIPPVPFLKGVAGLSLKVVEMVDATKQTDRTLISLKNHAREFSMMLETHMTTPYLSPSIQAALEDLVQDLFDVQHVLKKMSKNGTVHRYVLQPHDQRILNGCVSRLQEAHMSFLTKCIVSIASEVGAIRAHHEVPKRDRIMHVADQSSFLTGRRSQQTHKVIEITPPRSIPPNPMPNRGLTM